MCRIYVDVVFIQRMNDSMGGRLLGKRPGHVASAYNLYKTYNNNIQPSERDSVKGKGVNSL